MKPRVEVEEPPYCGECHVRLDYLDDYVISWQFVCPQCGRAYQVPGRTKAEGWEKVEANFNFKKAPPPPHEERRIAWLISEAEEF